MYLVNEWGLNVKVFIIIEVVSKTNDWKINFGQSIATWLYALWRLFVKVIFKYSYIKHVYQKYFYDSKLSLPVLSSSKNKSFDHRNQ